MEGTTLSDKFSTLTTNDVQVISHAPDPSIEISPDYVRSLSNPAKSFLCKISDNWPVLKFGGFKIRDMVSGITLVEV